MFDTLLWGIIQGLTEFFPVSSSGHLILVPAWLNQLGWEVGEPSRSVQAVLHLGTLVAVCWFYRSDLSRLLRFRTDPHAARMVFLLFGGTIPAVVVGGIVVLSGRENPSALLTSFWLLSNGALIWLAWLWVRRKSLHSGMSKQLPFEQPPCTLTNNLSAAQPNHSHHLANWSDGVSVGCWQVLGLIPGISRSGSTIIGAQLQGFSAAQAVRFSFLLSIPTIAGAGLLSGWDLLQDGQSIVWGELLVGLLVSGVTGYLAIGWVIQIVQRVGLFPFGIYCVLLGGLGLFWLS